MFIIGLTGSIASGKTSISSMLEKMGFPIVDADAIARRVVEKGMPALERIKKEFGEEVLNSDGTLDRKALGQMVFSSSKKLELLNSITHPAIIEEINRNINALSDKGEKMCVLDAPLLIESGINGMADSVLLVYVDDRTQLSRLMNRDNISEELALKKISSQMGFEEKRKYADYVIDNSRSLDYTKAQLEKIIATIRGMEDSNG
jgi:dephospho-CoA kinase